MCELCTGEFEEVETLEVARTAMMVERLYLVGTVALHSIIEDVNVDDNHLMDAIDGQLEPNELAICQSLMAMDRASRVSTLAKAAHLWGCDPIPHETVH